jgi:hypothetical protein
MPIITGRYVFSPTLGTSGNRARRDGGTTDWWLIIQCDRDVGRYLRHLYASAHPAAGPVNEPLWGPHVSVVHGEVPPNPDPWSDRQGREIAFEYAQEAEETDGYIYHPVTCIELLDYREQLGLTRAPRLPLHLTIGNFK